MKTTKNVGVDGLALAALVLLAGGAKVWGDAPRARFISHRGESLAAPENTMAAFRAAVERGADGIECDIYLTKDNEIVCLHDRTTKRTAGADLAVTNATLAELQALDAGAWKGPTFAGERIPTLAETLSLARDNFEIFVEVKCGTEIMPRLAEVLAAEPKATPERVLFICFNTNVVAAVRRQHPDYRVYWLTGTGPKKDGKPGPTAAEVVAAAKACNASGVDAQDSADITQQFVNVVKEAGLSFHIWTVNRARRASALAAMGVETITSDCGATLATLMRVKPDGGPLIHWTFDGVATNSGSGGPLFDAALSGSPAYTNGVIGQGLALDGVDDFASAAYPFQEQGTLSLWYKPEAFYNFNTVFDNSNNPNLWEMWIGGDGRLKFRMGKGAGEVSCGLGPLGGPVRWYHLALVWDNVNTNLARLYVNGDVRARGPIDLWFAPGGAFHVGGGNAGNTKGRGTVDDVRVYGTPLSDAQVRALFAGDDGTLSKADVPDPAMEVWPRLEANLRAAASRHVQPLRRGQRLLLDASQAALAPAIDRADVVRRHTREEQP